MQLSLPLADADADLLDAALDEIRTRFGPTAVTRAVLVGRSPGLTVPLLPD
jgi:DNA polymerase-4